MNALRSDALPTEDLRYVGQLVAQRTGLPQPDAEKRVSNAYARMQGKLEQAKAAAQEAAEKARKTSIHTTLWLFISLLMGAFSASLAATYGGRQRDL
jgi:cell division protein FtsN